MNANTTPNTTANADDRAAVNPESATATPATIPADGAQTVTPATIPADGAQTVTPAPVPVPTPADGVPGADRDRAAAFPESAAPAPNAAAKQTYRTRQFDLGNGRRLVDMRPTSGGVEIIREAPGVTFDGLQGMSRDDAILAALDCDELTDAERVALVREIVTAGHADGGDAIR